MERASTAILLFLCALSVHGADKSLTIVKAGPVGEVASLEEAAEIRVVFSDTPGFTERNQSKTVRRVPR